MRPTSRGIAFVEFTNANLLQQALKLHHTDLDGRRINVELTVGGGGSGSARKEKLDEKKGRMTEQRDRKAEKEAEEGGEAAQAQGEGEVKLRGGRRVKPKTDGQVRCLIAEPATLELTVSPPNVRLEAKVTQAEEVAVVIEVAVDSAVEAGAAEIEVAEVVEGEVEEDEVDTALALGRSGSLRVQMPSRSDSLAQMALTLIVTIMLYVRILCRLSRRHYCTSTAVSRSGLVALVTGSFSQGVHRICHTRELFRCRYVAPTAQERPPGKESCGLPLTSVRTCNSTS